MLSLVSLFTDMASEMLYPVLPVYLNSIGFSVFFIGILEGFAELIAGLGKAYFGKVSDQLQKRLPFVQLGYALSAISKPLFYFFSTAPGVFAARTIDRIGKGVRTGARDALLSDESTKENKARAFGFHRSMDTIGAVIGPLSALVFLYYYPGNYQILFLLAFFPGLLAILFTFLIKEKQQSHPIKSTKPGWKDFMHFWKNSPLEYKRFTSALLIFALFNSSDVFLLLQLKNNGFSDTTLIGVYIFYNLVYVLAAFPLGILADKWGMKLIFCAGLLLFSLVYAGISFCSSTVACCFLFALYGIYAAATDGIAKAWISNICKKEETATAIGTYAAFQSIAALLASSITGFLWFQFGVIYAFIPTAIISLLVAWYIFKLKPGTAYNN